MKGRPRSISPVMEARLIRLRAEGSTVDQIAADLGVGKRAVGYAITRLYRSGTISLQLGGADGEWRPLPDGYSGMVSRDGRLLTGRGFPRKAYVRAVAHPPST